jgi:uncharacterized protein with ParB-like and HNH nuclease domain
METRTKSLAQLYQEGLFDVPAYQRSYSWQESQLEDLLDDLRYLPEDSNHFFGNIILDKKDDQYETDRGRQFDVFDVVDGQQRLTTALILLHVATQFDDVVSETISEDNLIFPIDERPRLMPQDQDGEFFRDSLFGTSNLELKTPSQGRLEEAYNFFKSEFEELSDDITVRDITERLRYSCKINVVEIDGDSEAASIFESLNDRGKPLSSLDKTKSFLMYMDDRSSNHGALEEKIKQRFGGIYRELFVLSNGHSRVSDFDEDSVQRFHWGIYDGYDSDEYFSSLDTLKDRLRDDYRNGEYEAVQTEIDNYTQHLREGSSAFARLFNPSKRPTEVEDALTRLLALSRVANVLPVLMAAQMEYGDEEPEKMAAIVRACETLVFRVYAVDGRRADTGRSRLVRLAHSINSDDSYLFEDVLNRLNSITRIYADDDRFERNLRDPEFYDTMSSRDTRYLLYHYGQSLDIDMGENVQRDLEQILSSDFEVEHILAQELNEDHIPESIREEFSDNVHRLGNLTIASGYWNKAYGNLPFSKKKVAEDGREKEYKSSGLRVQQILANYNKFGREEIEEREQEIIEFALGEWEVKLSESKSGNSTNREGAGEPAYDSLPDNFFRRLTNRQEAFIRILLEADGWVLNEDIRQKMEEEYNLSSGGGQAMAGILSGFTRKYNKDFRDRLIANQWAGSQVKYRLNPESEFEAELRERLT